MGNYKRDLKLVKKKMWSVPYLTDENIHMTQAVIRRLMAFDLIKSETWDGPIQRYTLTSKGEFFDDFEKERIKEWFAIGIKELVVAILSGGIVLIISLTLN
jgi:predicted transcriptional regulator